MIKREMKMVHEKAWSGRRVCALTIFAVLAALASGTSAADYDFTFTVRDYAKEIPVGGYVGHVVIIENVGTELDTVNLSTVKDLPAGWFADLCVRGKCVPTFPLDLAPGQVDSAMVEVFAGAAENVGLVAIRGVSRGNPGLEKRETLATFAGIPSILLVDDDAGAGYETYLEAAVDSAGFKTRVWDADSLGRPGALRLASYWAVLWTTADGDASYLTAADEQDMVDYLDGGGNLFLASMNMLSSRGGATTLTADYLHIDSWTADTGGGVVSGFPGDEISDGMTLSLLGGPFSPAGTDNMTLDGNADSIFVSTAGISGLKSVGAGHHVVFLSFPFEAVSQSDPDPDNGSVLIARVIDWFGPPVAGVGETGTGTGAAPILCYSRPNPFSGSTEISFALSRGGTHVLVEVYDARGRLVRSLLEGAASAGVGSVTWDGRDEVGSRVAPGLYFSKVSTGEHKTVTKMVLLE
jgi:hypothetical protein